MGRGKRDGNEKGGMVRGKEGVESGGSARLGYLSRGLEFLVTPLLVHWVETNRSF